MIAQPRPDAIEAALGLRAVVPLGDHGAVLMLGFPGLCIAVDGTAWIDPAAMAEVIAGLSRRGVPVLVSLVCQGEVPADAGRLLARACGDGGLRLVRLPIPDYAAPGRRWLAAATRFGACLDRITASGRPVAVCCHYGAGRSGTVAAFLLIRQGLSAPAAIATVRGAFPEAIESEAQVRWLHEMAAV